MSSGNPFGLSELSHFGSFQRVGGKAGGFINKKFFHPSSMRNQERLWQAQTADERDRRKQQELEKRREEERQVEDLRKKMYLSGQGKASDFMATGVDVSAATDLSGKDRTELQQGIKEQKRRKAMLKRDHAERGRVREEELAASSEESDDDHAKPDDGRRILAQSRYREDLRILGHEAVWGSWYSPEDHRWGFGCCKTLDRTATCPLEPEEASVPAKEARGRKRRKQQRGNADVDGVGAGATTDASGETGATAGKGTEKLAGVGRSDEDSSLIDPAFIEAAERRREKKLQEELRKAEEKKKKEATVYLANLLVDPGNPS
eukprot:TRINITY_DN5819_c0_g2_i2.p1 TRINITY_DN5819_c0_g2~~TRINITY_DN5819_c0_g2_i2.p1  ORF type:complete len:348 (+),score=84.10 TRINITY_DN5819_c0_g2_i2:90-1046(+)